MRRARIGFVPTPETRLRLILADVMFDAGKLRETLVEFREAADRTYIESEIDRLQAAAHRIAAFLDGTEGETRN